jgi:hypothetical protein
MVGKCGFKYYFYKGHTHNMAYSMCMAMLVLQLS